ncbi:MAG: MATE family efflux transporter [Lachnospiraceae bacterium]|nr:MATE family efflux transporter [Lachnospiraceae bacterium]
MAAFSLPFLLSYFLQTLYGMADLFIVGQFSGVESITAVSIGSQIMHMITVIVVGLSMGTTVLIGRAVGAGEQERSGRIIGNTVTLLGGVSIVMAALLSLVIPQIMQIMAVPVEALEQTADYLLICFIGIPLITAYNIISSIFRGLGDSKSPMKIVAISCVLNIALDYLLIGGLGLKASGAALGTVLSQGASVLIALAVVLRRNLGITLRRSYFRPDRRAMSSLLKIGVPVALQDGFIQVSFLIITIFVNQRGVVDAAAVGIVEKIICFLFLVPSTLLSTVSAMAAQNLGAGQEKRARQSLGLAIRFALIYGLAVGLLMQVASRPLIGRFTADAAVVAMGVGYISSYVWDTLFAGMHFSFSGYFCACEKSWLSFLHNIASILVVRIPLAWLCSRQFPDTLFPMGFASTLGSVLSVIICFYAYRRMKHKQCAQNE